MTKRETIWLAGILVCAGIVLHAVHYLIFGDLHHIAIYLLGDVAFLPIEVLFVTLVVDRLLGEREKMERRHRLSMVIGVFFSELGRPLLETLRNSLEDGSVLRAVQLSPQTGERELRQAALTARHLNLNAKLEPQDLQNLRDLLQEHQDLSLALLANPTLLEHEEFSDVLWAVVHLREELVAREKLADLPESDVRHLEGDAQRVFRRLLAHWLQYLLHLHKHYPYLYSFAVRADPLQEGLRPEVMESA